MNFEISGKLIEKYDVQQVSDTFKKREFVLLVETEGNGRTFTDYLKFQLIQAKTDLIESYSVNDELKVNFNVKGNRWEKEGKVSYFTNLDAWRIEKAGASTGNMGQPAPPDSVYEQAAPPPAASKGPEVEDDLPF